MRIFRFILTMPAICIAALSVASGFANATSFCVATGTQLSNNLQTAQSNGVDDDIRIRSGVMTAPNAVNGLWSYRATASDQSTSLSISGGWNSTCTTQTLDPVATQLDAQNSGPALDILNVAGEPMSAQISVRNLTVARGRAEISQRAAAIYYSINASFGATFLLENVLVTSSVGANGASGNAAVYINQSGSGFVRVRNVVVSNNNLSNAGTGGLIVQMSGDAIAYVSNNTIFNNSGNLSIEGLALQGNITASNNAVAGNTSTAASSFEVFASVSTGLSLRNNHFETKLFTGNNQVENGTTTGDPQWNLVGEVAVPKPVSVLRDCGFNTPQGQLASTDYNGDARIINSVVDRGAIEAVFVPNVGPTISAVDPVPNSVTPLAANVVGAVEQFPIIFSANGGTAPGTTVLSCSDDNASVSLSPTSQTVAVGGNVQSVLASLTFTASGYLAQVTCTANTNGSSNSFVFRFSVPQAVTAFGPPLAPLANSTTNLTAVTLNQIVSSTLTFSAQQGDAGGTTQVQCTPLAGAIVVTSNGNQSVLTGAAVAPVTVAMSANGQVQNASVRCAAKRVGSAPDNYDYSFTLNAVDGFLKNGFE